MSPEAVNGEVGCAKADVWALGCVLHEAASLRPPFVANNPMALAVAIDEVGSTVWLSGGHGNHLRRGGGGGYIMGPCSPLRPVTRVCVGWGGKGGASGPCFLC